MSVDTLPAIYQLRVRLYAISPLIWRRILVRSDTSIAFLHHSIQLAFGWTDSHLHRFVIHGKAYGLAYVGGISFTDDPWQIRLADFGFRPNERFAYEYDFGDLCQHEIRIEQILPRDPMQAYPVCTGGARSAARRLWWPAGVSRVASAFFHLPHCRAAPGHCGAA
jgi:hypothetical protein